MAVQSYIGLVNYIENFAQNHLQIRRFKAEFDEQLPNFATETEAYPILFMSPSSNVYAQNDDRFVVNFYCFDVIQKDRSNINTIYSDCSLILNDLKKFIQDGDNYLFNVDSIEATATPINNALLDYVAGVQMQLIIQVDTYSYCEIPLDDGILVPTSGVDVVYSQYLTCETVTGCTTLQDYITTEVQSQASTTFSGGSVVNDTIFQSNVTISGDTFVNNLTGNTATFNNYVSGGTSLEQVINNLIDGAEDITRVQPGSNIITGGTDNFPIINVVDSPAFNNLTFSGAVIGNTIGANTGLFLNLNSVGISGQTFYSGGTPLEDVILSIAGGEEDITRVQPGTNITTGGTANFPTVNLSNNISVTSISASTIVSGGTNLQTILNGYTTDAEFAGHTANTSNPHNTTAAQVGAYTTAQTNNLLNTKANLSGATFTGTINAPVIQSGGTDLYSIFSTVDTNDITRVQAGSNINTGGTANAPIVSLTANPSVNNLTFSGTAIGGSVQAGAGTFTSLSATTLSGDGSSLTGIIVPEQVFDWTFSNSTTNSDPGAKFFKLDNSSLNLVSKIYISYSATNLTNLSSIVKNLETGDRIYLQQKNNQKNGALYLVTASTIVNGTWITIPVSWISSAENNDFNNNKEGVFTFVKKNANNYYTTGATVSGTSISFNRNDLANAYSVNLSALTGNVQIAGNLSATTFFSGSTPLSTVISNLATGDVTRVQNGLNTYTGGTGNFPTINISAATLNNLSVSGTSVLAATSATTIAVLNNTSATTTFNDYNGNAIESGTSLSNIIGGQNNRIPANKNNIQIIGGNGITATTDGTTYVNNFDVKGALLSGGTNLYSIFSTSNDITRVQPGSNITTGGTANNPVINLAASPSINGLSFSGTATGNALSATTLSGGTILSGGTNLYSIFLPQTGLIPYDFMAAASDESTAITTGATKLTFYAPRTFTLTGVTVSLVTSGSTTTTVDVNYNGSSVFATPVSLASGVFYATTATTTSAIAKYGKFTVDFDAAGTGAKGVKITLEGRTTI